MSHITINNHKTYYEVYGSGVPILFIHGLGSNTLGWQYQIEFFSKYYKVFVYDVRGHGQSDRQNFPYSVKMFSDDCFLFINEVIKEPTHIVGLSMGGIIAFQLAVEHADVILKLVIVNSIPEFKVDSPRLKIKLLSRIFITRLLGMKAIGKILSKQLLSGNKKEELRKNFVVEWSKNDKKSYLNAINAMVGWSVASHLKNIKNTTLIISSEFDYTPVSLKKYYADKMPNAELVIIKNCKHALPVENPKEFNETILNFLKAK